MQFLYDDLQQGSGLSDGPLIILQVLKQRVLTSHNNGHSRLSQGRATWYGGPLSFLSNFKNRGSPPEYGFGDIYYGSCGYYEQVLVQNTMV
jgi:hypothetical protein